jgi:hypothetical protein
VFENYPTIVAFILRAEALLNSPNKNLGIGYYEECQLCLTKLQVCSNCSRKLPPTDFTTANNCIVLTSYTNDLSGPLPVHEARRVDDVTHHENNQQPESKTKARADGDGIENRAGSTPTRADPRVESRAAREGGGAGACRHWRGCEGEFLDATSDVSFTPAQCPTPPSTACIPFAMNSIFNPTY